MDTVYLGLLTVNGTEPPPTSGYVRIPGGIGDLRGQFVFPEVKKPGYGLIQSIAIYTANGDLQRTITLPEPLDVHTGVVPVISNGKLWRGVDVKARVIVQPGTQCRGGSKRPPK